MSRVPVITVDGPSASGKSSVSRALAEHLQWPWVSTGAFYRALGFLVQQSQVDPSNEDQVLGALASQRMKVAMAAEKTRVFVDDHEVTDQIYTEEVGKVASVVSAHPQVRAELLQAQRDCATGQVGLIAEGRDCGSVVFPEAELKFFLEADTLKRALRRAQETGQSTEKVEELQKERDQRDKTRKTAPTAIPEGAHVIDTSSLSLPEVVARVTEITTKTLNR